MQILSNSLSQTLNLGKKIAKILKEGSLVCLFGELGSGKTTLTKGIAQGLGLNKKEIISPSFVLVRVYKLKKINFYHLDLYRLKKRKELFNLGYEDYLYPDGITIIEWADRIEDLLPKEYLRIELEHKGENKRLMRIIPKGAANSLMVKRLKTLIREDANFRN